VGGQEGAAEEGEAARREVEKKERRSAAGAEIRRQGEEGDQSPGDSAAAGEEAAQREFGADPAARPVLIEGGQDPLPVHGDVGGRGGHWTLPRSGHGWLLR